MTIAVYVAVVFDMFSHCITICRSSLRTGPTDRRNTPVPAAPSSPGLQRFPCNIATLFLLRHHQDSGHDRTATLDGRTMAKKRIEVFLFADETVCNQYGEMQVGFEFYLQYTGHSIMPLRRDPSHRSIEQTSTT